MFPRFWFTDLRIFLAGLGGREAKRQAARREAVRSALRKGDLEGAVADWTASLARDPSKVAVVARRAAALLSLLRADEAYRDFSQVLELDPRNAEAYVGRADVWRLRGDQAGVRRNLEAALAAAPRGWSRREAVEAELRSGLPTSFGYLR